MALHVVSLAFAVVAASGTYVRLETPNGPVHVWRPPGYEAATAGIVVYVHGHQSSADHSWTEHHLDQQFAKARVNALFVVPDAMVDGEADLTWESLGALLRVVERGTKIPRPSGPLVVVGHSGAYKTILAWIEFIHLQQIILLDGFYDGDNAFRAWLDGDQNRRLTLVSAVTRDRTERFLKGLRGAVSRTGVPRAHQLSSKERGARVLHLRAQFGHMEVVTSGKVIPEVLRHTALKGLPGGRRR